MPDSNEITKDFSRICKDRGLTKKYVIASLMLDFLIDETYTPHKDLKRKTKTWAQRRAEWDFNPYLAEPKPTE